MSSFHPSRQPLHLTRIPAQFWPLFVNGYLLCPAALTGCGSAPQGLQSSMPVLQCQENKWLSQITYPMHLHTSRTRAAEARVKQSDYAQLKMQRPNIIKIKHFLPVK